MATRVKLSEQWDRKANRFQFYRRFIGGRSFVLTQDRTQSEIIAAALIATWMKLKASDETWTEAIIRTAYAEGGIDKGQISTPCERGISHQKPTPKIYKRMDLSHATIVTSTPQPKGAKLYGVIDEYLADYRTRTKWSRHQRETGAMATFKRYQKDCEIISIDADKLRAIVAHFRARPVSRNGIPMAVTTVQTVIKAIKSFFDWSDANDKWIAPRRFERLFKIKYDALKTPLERKKESLGVETFTLDELATIYAAATPRQRLYIALALNIGETAQGISDLLKADVSDDGKVIDRMRGKTSVQGIYPLWPEVQALVKAERDNDPNRPLLFCSADGHPLVHPNEKGTGRVDAIDKTWRQSLSKRVKTRLSFKYLRKTGATFIQSLTKSESIAQLYLSHKPSTVAGKHYVGRDFTDLAEALPKLRSHLEPMFAAAKPRKAASRVAGAA